MNKEELVQQIKSGVPVNKIEAIRKHYRDLGYGHKTFIKEFRPEKQIIQKVDWVVDILDLHKAPMKRCLDIGTGAGFFPYVLKQCGHYAEMADVGEGVASEAYLQCIELLGMKRTYEFPVMKKEIMPIPPHIIYDVITASGVAFHPNWNPLDWDFFINDCFSHLSYGGVLFMQVNNTGKAKKGWDGLQAYLQFTSEIFTCHSDLIVTLHKVSL